MSKNENTKSYSSIRTRLIVSFIVVAAIAVGSATIAWISIEQSRARTNSVINETLPYVSNAQNLSKEVALFTVTASELPKITNEWERRKVLRKLEKRIDIIQTELDGLQRSQFTHELFESVQNNISLQLSNLQKQSKLAQDFIATQYTLRKALESLQEKQQNFIAIANPRIAKEHKKFLRQGREIGAELRALLAQETFQIPEEERARLDDSVRVGIQTLFSTAVGEMRANLEMVAITFQVAGLLYEAANVDKIDRVAELHRQYLVIQPDIRRIKLILAQSAIENRMILIKAIPVVNHGKGEKSIFALREQELSYRLQAVQYSENTIKLSEQLSNEVDTLTASSKELAIQASKSLDQSLEKAKLLQIIAVVFAVFLSVAIGWGYVSKRVIQRILKLKEAMEQHAAGNDVGIPSDGNDEISGMAQSLQHFVDHRAKVEAELRSAITSLNDVENIARLGSFEKRISNGDWSWSNVFYDIIGYSERELPAGEDNFWKLVYPEDKQLVEELFTNSSPVLENKERTIRLLHKNGEIRTVIIYLAQSYIGSEIWMQRGTVQDVTERLKMEEELLQVRKLESIGVLAGGVAHDYNNIMTGILGNVSLAINVLGPDHKVTEYLKTAENATKKARDLTAKLAVFAEGADADESLTDIPELVDELVQEAIAGSKVDCKVEIAQELWPAKMKSKRLRQVIANLLGNAVNAMPEGGRLELRCENISEGEKKKLKLNNGPCIKLQIIDSGTGIDSKNLDKIFDPYFSTEERGARKGIGLGLALSRSIMSKHKGEIRVESQPGKGTVVTLFIPAVG